MFTIDVGNLLKHLGSPSEIRRQMVAHGYPQVPSIKGMQKWRERNSLPSDWLARLLMLPALAHGRAKGPPVDVRKFIKRETQDG